MMNKERAEIRAQYKAIETNSVSADEIIKLLHRIPALLDALDEAEIVTQYAKEWLWLCRHCKSYTPKNNATGTGHCSHNNITVAPDNACQSCFEWHCMKVDRRLIETEDRFTGGE